MEYKYSVKYIVNGQTEVKSGSVESDKSIAHVVSSILDDITRCGGKYINGSLELNQTKNWFL